MKLIEKVLSVVLVSLTLFSIFTPVQAVEVKSKNSNSKVETITSTEPLPSVKPTIAPKTTEKEKVIKKSTTSKTSEQTTTEAKTKAITLVKQKTEVPTKEKDTQEKKTEVSAKAVTNTVSTKATVAGGTIGDTYSTDIEDVKDSSGTKISGTVKYEYFQSGSSNNKYRYPNGTKSGKAWYSGKIARITITAGKVKAVWTVTESTLTNKSSDTVDQGTGTLVVNRTESGSLPNYYYKDGTDKAGQTIKVWAPWNGTRLVRDKKSEYTHSLNHNKVTAIKFDSKVTAVGQYNFYGFKGKLSKVTFSDKTTEIKERAFSSSGVSDIVWNGAKKIGPAAFSSCNSLKTLDLKNAHTLSAPGKSGNTTDMSDQKYYDTGVFSSCDNLTSVNFGAVTTVAKKAFSNCTKLSSITWGSVTKIDSFAFSSAGSASLTLNIGGNVSTLSDYACKNTAYGTVTFSGSKLTSTGGTATFASSDNLTKVNVGSYVTTIANETFKSCKKLKTIQFGTSAGAVGNLKTIGKDSFRDCSALISGIVGNGGTAEMFGYSDGAVIPDSSASNYNVMVLPSTITNINSGAFRKCTSLRAITWNNINNVTLTSIKYNTFYNDYQLQFFALPDSVTTIEGTYNNNDTIDTTKEEKKFGAFALDEETVSSNNLNHSLWFAVSQNHSKLKVIGDKAFFHPQIIKSTSNVGKGLVFWDRTGKKAVGESANNTKLLVFPSLEYIGDRAFMNNPDLTGALLSQQYIIIGQRSFANTSLTDFYFKWNADNKVNSSFIGSSSSFINSKKRAYTHNTDLASAEGLYGYSSLYSVINNQSKGLIALWASFFSDLSFAGYNYDNWKAEIGADEPKQGDISPELSYGKNNGITQSDTKKGLDIETANYIKTETKWTTINKVAEEKVTFGYKNKIYTDYIFVVDNSPSMDRVSYNSAYNQNNVAGYQSDKDTPYEGTYNASKLMNAYSQIYDISKQVLKSDNTVSVISFRGNNRNELEKSSKFLVPSGTSLTNISNATMTKPDDVYNALFANDNGYKDENDGVTNYSSGLSRAYQLIKSLQKDESSFLRTKRMKVVIMITDGTPTYYDGSKAVSSTNDNADKNGVSQVDGVDWAKAIRGNGKYSARSYSNSYYTNSKTYNVTTDEVSGVNTDIYGIVVGGDKREPMIDVTNDEYKVFFNRNMKKIGPALSNIIKEVVSENYKVVIPLDDNFTLKVKTNDYNNLSVEDFKLTKDGKTVSAQNKNNIIRYSENCKISYNSHISSIILDFNVSSLDDSVTPYSTYTLTFSLDYEGGGGEYIASNSKKYVAVNDNSSETSRSGANPTYESIYIKTYNKTVSNGNVAGAGNSGAYVLLTRGTDIPQIALFNYAPPIYLPIETGSIQLFKYASVVNGAVETKTGSKSLAGAEFTLYDENYNKVKFTSTSSNGQFFDYSWTDTSNTRTTVLSRTDFIMLRKLPLGTYYLVETKYPDVNGIAYTASSLNDTTTIILPGTEKPIQAFKIDVTANNAAYQIVYNKPIPKTYGKIEGVKRAMVSSTHYVCVELEGAKMGLFSTFNDARKKTNCISTAVSDHEGRYSFSLQNSKIKANTAYYVREIEAPDGYQLVNIVREVNVKELNQNVSVDGDIYDIELRKIKVTVDSSDGVQEGFDISLIGNYDEYGNENVEYKGVSGKDGTYTFEVPAFYTYSIYPGDSHYTAIQYRIKESGYKGESIPSRYMTPEYAENNNKPVSLHTTYFYLEKTSDWNGNLSNWGGTYAGNTIPTNSRVSIFNPSIRLTVHNYDGDDKTTPLSSSYKIINKKNYYGITEDTAVIPPSESEIINDLPSWSIGNLNLTDGSEYMNGSMYYRTDFIDIEDFDVLKFEVSGSKFTYNVVFYDEEKSFISAYDKDTNFVKNDFIAKIPKNAKYARLLRHEITGTSSQNNSLTVKKIKGGTVTFDNWYGQNSFDVEQTQVQEGYNLESDVEHANNYPLETCYDKTTGRKYYQIDITFYNSKSLDMPVVGGNGIFLYIFIGIGFVILSLFFLMIGIKKYKQRLKALN